MYSLLNICYIDINGTQNNWSTDYDEKYILHTTLCNHV